MTNFTNIKQKSLIREYIDEQGELHSTCTYYYGKQPSEEEIQKLIQETIQRNKRGLEENRLYQLKQEEQRIKNIAHSAKIQARYQKNVKKR